MNKKNSLIKWIMVGGILIPSLGVAHHYKQTTGYQNLALLADSLNGRSFQTDPAFHPYCNEYAAVSVRQTQQRISQSCTSAIPLSNDGIRKRWSSEKWGHKGWCMSVSSRISKKELVSRENSLKSCLSWHPPVNNHLQVQKDCLANDKIHKQAARGNISYVNACLDAGVGVDVREVNRWTPLHSAARNGRLEMAKALLRRGAAINARDKYGKTPLDQAIAGNYLAVQKYLKNQGGI